MPQMYYQRVNSDGDVLEIEVQKLKNNLLKRYSNYSALTLIYYLKTVSLEKKISI